MLNLYINMLKDFIIKDDKAALAPSTIISLAIALIIMAIMVPIALSEFFLANTSGWGSSTVRLWDIIPIFVVITIVMSVISTARDKL